MKFVSTKIRYFESIFHGKRKELKFSWKRRHLAISVADLIFPSSSYFQFLLICNDLKNFVRKLWQKYIWGPFSRFEKLLWVRCRIWWWISIYRPDHFELTFLLSSCMHLLIYYVLLNNQGLFDLMGIARQYCRGILGFSLKGRN